MSTTTSYCTIIARNYLPKALALAESLKRHGDADRLFILVIDAEAGSALPEVQGVVWLSPGDLALTGREVLDLAMMYDLVEFATAVKPLLLLKLLADTEQAVYLDPDTYVVAPMAELSPAIADSKAGILLTPHFLDPASGEDTLFAEGHLLYVGVYNLGFCAVDRRADQFLHWWWGHLSTECLHSPMDGLFVDQKWVDVGSVLFDATKFSHYGYNVSIGNLPERPIGADGDGLCISSNGDRLRLFHFHAFDPSNPDELSAKFKDRSNGGIRLDNDVVRDLCREYAAAVVANQKLVGPAADYGYGTDTRGRPISRRLRGAYRAALLAGVPDLASPFLADEASRWDEWRKGAWRSVTKELVSDAAKSARLILPDEYTRLKTRFPRVIRIVRNRALARSGIWE